MAITIMRATITMMIIVMMIMKLMTIMMTMKITFIVHVHDDDDANDDEV